MTTNEPQRVSQPRNPRWYRLTADRVIVSLLAFEGFLLLSEWFDWFAFNGQTWMALIVFAGVALVVVLLLLWFITAQLLHWQFQYGLHSLILLGVTVTIPCSWLAVEREQERRQGEAADQICRLGGRVESELTWLGRLLRDDSLVSVTQVNLAGTLATDTGLLHFQELRQLQILMLNGTDITDAGLVHLQGLSRLRWLVLDSTEVTDAGLVHLQGVRRLRWLYLNYTKVTDAGLVDIQGLRQLRCLGLHGTKVTDAGLVHLQGLRQLQRLGLSGTDITDAGLVHLQGLRQLKDLSLEETQVTDAGVNKLEYALPNCKVSRG